MGPGAHDDTIPVELEQSCAQEPIHLLGTVQSYGFLMAVDLASRCIVQVSAGILRHWPGLQDAESLLAGPLSDWVDGGEGSDAPDIASLPATHPVALPWRPRFERTCPAADRFAASHWECLGHRSGLVAVLEWLPINAGPDELLRQNQIFADFGEVIARLRRTDGLDTFFAECVKVIQDMSGFDRVMMYRFLPDGCGEVVAEHTANGYPQQYLGLRFPASDIPSQARRLYLTNKLRVLADVEAATDALLPPALPNGEPLDQSHCLLRGLSPVHLVYLRNMGVRATLTLSIVLDGSLWGLIACHHHRPRTPALQLREGMRQLSELLAEIVNMRIETLSRLEAVQQRLKLDHLLNEFHQALIQEGDIPNLLELWMPRLLPAFNADAMGVQIGTLAFVGGPGKRQGATHQILDEVGTRLDSQSLIPQVYMRDDLLASEKTHALRFLPEAAGLLLAQRHDEGIIFCFVTRQEVVHQVRWGGEPVKDFVIQSNGRVRLEPRRSFAVWQESVRGHCDPWMETDAEALQNLLRMLCEVNKLQVNRQMQETLHWRAHHDHLTGLYNRRAMEDEVSRRLEDGQYDTALMLLDLDHFKKINDTYGHGVGDEVLKEFARRLSVGVRATDTPARMSGDEFVVILEEIGSRVEAERTAAKIVENMRIPFRTSAGLVQVSTSVGLSLSQPRQGQEQLLAAADSALYAAKAKGRDGYAYVDNEAPRS